MCFEPKTLKYGNSVPDPQKLKLLIFFMFTRSDSLICFQGALNHYLEMIVSQDMIFSHFYQSGHTDVQYHFSYLTGQKICPSCINLLYHDIQVVGIEMFTHTLTESLGC